MNDTLLKLMKYCLIGLSGVGVDFGVTYILKEKLHSNKYLANASGFLLAASSNFLLNSLWTFQQTRPVSVEYFLFIGICLIGLTINTIIIYLLINKLSYNFYLSKGIAIVIVTLWNFFMNYTFTFK